MTITGEKLLNQIRQQLDYLKMLDGDRVDAILMTKYVPLDISYKVHFNGKHYLLASDYFVDNLKQKLKTYNHEISPYSFMFTVGDFVGGIPIYVDEELVKLILLSVSLETQKYEHGTGNSYFLTNVP